MTSSWFFLSTLNYDARSTTQQINTPDFQTAHSLTAIFAEFRSNYSKVTKQILTLVCLCSYMSPVSRTLLDIPKSAILHILLWSTRTLRAARSRWIICGHITTAFSNLICNGCLQQQSRILTILQVMILCLLLPKFRVTLIIFNFKPSSFSVSRDQKKNVLSANKTRPIIAKSEFRIFV